MNAQDKKLRAELKRRDCITFAPKYGRAGGPDELEYVGPTPGDVDDLYRRVTTLEATLRDEIIALATSINLLAHALGFEIGPGPVIHKREEGLQKFPGQVFPDETGTIE